MQYYLNWISWQEYQSKPNEIFFKPMNWEASSFCPGIFHYVFRVFQDEFKSHIPLICKLCRIQTLWDTWVDTVTDFDNAQITDDMYSSTKSNTFSKTYQKHLKKKYIYIYIYLTDFCSCSQFIDDSF